MSPYRCRSCGSLDLWERCREAVIPEAQFLNNGFALSEFGTERLCVSVNSDPSESIENAAAIMSGASTNLKQ
jgi:DNA-directed RNA polymerase subunit N (RpoN/RPB10)